MITFHHLLSRLLGMLTVYGSSKQHYYAPAPNMWGIKRCFCLTSVYCVHWA